MPRGIRGSADHAAQLQKMDDQIARCAERMANLKAQRQELLTKKQENDLRELYSYMQENSLSAAEVLAQLAPAVAASTAPTDIQV